MIVNPTALGYATLTISHKKNDSTGNDATNGIGEQCHSADEKCRHSASRVLRISDTEMPLIAGTPVVDTVDSASEVEGMVDSDNPCVAAGDGKE